MFQYHELQKEDFLDSVGVFYTDLPANAIKAVSYTHLQKYNSYCREYGKYQARWQIGDIYVSGDARKTEDNPQGLGCYLVMTCLLYTSRCV